MCTDEYYLLQALCFNAKNVVYNTARPDWQAAHEACRAVLIPADNDSPRQWGVERGGREEVGEEGEKRGEEK